MTSLKAASLRRLSELIEGELALLRHELGPVLKLKQRALVANQVTQLQDLAGRELRLGGRLAALEGERIAATAEVARAYGLTDGAEELTLSELLAALPASSARDELAELAPQLSEALLALAWVNGDNGHLTQNLLDYTRLVVRLVTQGDAQPHYGSDGRVAGAAASRAMLDDRI